MKKTSDSKQNFIFGGLNVSISVVISKLFLRCNYKKLKHTSHSQYLLHVLGSGKEKSTF